MSRLQSCTQTVTYCIPKPGSDCYILIVRKCLGKAVYLRRQGTHCQEHQEGEYVFEGW